MIIFYLINEGQNHFICLQIFLSASLNLSFKWFQIIFMIILMIVISYKFVVSFSIIIFLHLFSICVLKKGNPSVVLNLVMMIVLIFISLQSNFTKKDSSLINHFRLILICFPNNLLLSRFQTYCLHHLSHVHQLVVRISLQFLLHYFH